MSVVSEIQLLFRNKVYLQLFFVIVVVVNVIALTVATFFFVIFIF